MNIIAEQTVVDEAETCDANDINDFINDALKSVLRESLVLALDSSSEIRDSFEDAIDQLKNALKSLTKTASVMAIDTAGMDTINRYAAILFK